MSQKSLHFAKSDQNQPPQRGVEPTHQVVRGRQQWEQKPSGPSIHWQLGKLSFHFTTKLLYHLSLQIHTHLFSTFPTSFIYFQKIVERLFSNWQKSCRQFSHSLTLSLSHSPHSYEELKWKEQQWNWKWDTQQLTAHWCW